MDATKFVTQQRVLMDLASLSSLDLEDAKDELIRRGVKEPTFDQCYDTLSSMRLVFSKIFMEELHKLAA